MRASFLFPALWLKEFNLVGGERKWMEKDAPRNQGFPQVLRTFDRDAWVNTCGGGEGRGEMEFLGLKTAFLKSRINPWKIAKSSLVKVASYKPATLLKIDFFTHISKDFS